MSRFGAGLIAGLNEPPGNDSFTKILLHMDGSNGGTSVIDSNVGGSAHTWTANGSAVTSTSSPIFGTACYDAPTSPGWISTPNHADFTLTGDWTVDFRMRSSQIYTAGTINLMGRNVAASANSDLKFISNQSGQITVQAQDASASTKAVTYSTAINDGAWHHVAGVRSSNVLYLYIDGISRGTPVAITSALSINSSWSVGRAGDNGSQAQYYLGQFDEVRFSNGIARWTANFTPPSLPYGP